MGRTLGVYVVALIVLAGSSNAFAQGGSSGRGRVEIGGFPGGGTFFVLGDDNKEVNFNVYTAGGDITYYLSTRTAVEGEVTGSVGLAQDVVFNHAKVLHLQMPWVWTYFGNVLYFPGGSGGTRFPLYVTGGIGAVQLKPRPQARVFGYDDSVGTQTFIAENIGGGVKWFRTDSPNWGFRADYRFLIVGSNDGAPAFFAKSKTRGAHRVYVGLVYIWKR